MTHPLDPRLIDFALPTRRIYLDNTGDLFAVVDDIDYLWALRWRWKWKRSKRSTLLYAKRTTRTEHGGASFGLYLHIEIMKRAEPQAPDDHTLVDHRDRDSLNCRRDNLRWSTFAMNMANRQHGRRCASPDPEARAGP